MDVYIQVDEKSNRIVATTRRSRPGRRAALADQIVEALERQGGRLTFDDDSSPEAIRQKFGVSKGAFKQALGGLYKAGRIRFLSPGIELIVKSTPR